VKQQMVTEPTSSSAKSGSPLNFCAAGRFGRLWLTAKNVTLFGPTRTSGDVSPRAAIRGMADIEHSSSELFDLLNL
jgi:hypothetical protein